MSDETCMSLSLVLLALEMESASAAIPILVPVPWAAWIAHTSSVLKLGV